MILWGTVTCSCVSQALFFFLLLLRGLDCQGCVFFLWKIWLTPFSHKCVCVCVYKRMCVNENKVVVSRWAWENKLNLRTRGNGVHVRVREEECVCFWELIWWLMSGAQSFRGQANGRWKGTPQPPPPSSPFFSSRYLSDMLVGTSWYANYFCGKTFGLVVPFLICANVIAPQFTWIQHLASKYVIKLINTDYIWVEVEYSNYSGNIEIINLYNIALP